MELSYRMQQIADCVKKGERLADVGTDHGFVPIYLVEKNIIPKAIAMDIGKGPLQRAIEHVEQHCLTAQIECRLSNGLEQVEPSEADAVVIAGMGGDLIRNILEAANPDFFKSVHWILQPQSEIYKVRKIIHEKGCKIVKESFFMDEGKYYNVLDCMPGKEYYESQVEYVYGKYLLEQKNEVLNEYIEKQLHKLEEISNKIISQNGIDSERWAEHTKTRVEEMKLEKKLLQEALGYFA